VKITKKIEIPEEILLSLRKSGDEFIAEMKKTAAVRYYQEKKLSIGQCAKLAEMSEEEFVKYLSSFNVGIFSFDDKR
jgi:predicted HTH domain antitoxin